MIGRKEDAERMTGTVEGKEGLLGGQRMLTRAGRMEAMKKAERQLSVMMPAAPGTLALQCPHNPAWAKAQQPGEKPKANPRFVCAFFSPSCGVEESHKMKALGTGASMQEPVSLAPRAAPLLWFLQEPCTAWC